MKKSRLSVKNLILLVVLAVVVVISVTVGGVYAAYTNSRHAQRTIATYDSVGDRFSSNDLGDGPSRDFVKTSYTVSSERGPSTVVTINNYERGKQTRPNDADVTYTLLARLVKYQEPVEPETQGSYVPVDAAYISDNSLSSYSITILQNSSSVTLGNTVLSHTFGGSLEGGATHSDAYTVTFSANFATVKPNLYLELIATPSGGSLPTLRGIFKADLRINGATNSWTGEFSDDTTVAPNSYDGFNYSISGVGSGSFTLTWNSEKVSLSYQSLYELLAISGASQTGDSITFPVDSDVTSKYDVQFYKVNISGENWTAMNTEVVTYDFR